MVGTAQGGGRRVEPAQMLAHCLPSPSEVTTLEDAFARRYGDLDRFLAAKEFNFSCIWPIPSLAGTGLPVTFEQDIDLDAMSDREFAFSLNTGISRPVFYGIGVLPSHQAQRTCLRYRYKVPKLVGEAFSGTSGPSAEFVELEDSLQQIRISFEESAALALPTSILTAGRFNILSDGYWNPMSEGVSYQEFTLPRNSRFGAVDISGEQFEVLEAIWNMLRKPGLLQAQKGVALAVRRLSYQAQRERAEDELLDIMIAAEALYLSELGNEPYRGELRYRLALRAALLADPATVALSKREVFDVLKSAYDARSAVAHGGTPNPRTLKVRGSHVRLADLVTTTRSIVAAGCQTAITRAAAEDGWPPDWDALTFRQL
jgi:hypothetical protein